MKLLQRICLFAAIPVILALCVCRTPLRFGAQADALFGTVADTYEAGDETVEVSRTSLPQGGSVLLLRGWTLGGEDRCVMGTPFADEIQAGYIENAHKPSVKNYRKAMELLGTDTGNTIFIGDQLFTDVYGAKRTGIRNILVKPIHPKEEIQIVLKRYLEKIVLHFYKKEEGIS